MFPSPTGHRPLSRTSPQVRWSPDGRRRRGHPAGLRDLVRRPGRGRLRRRPVGPAGRYHQARPGAANPDRRVDHPGLGGQPRLALVRPGHLLARVPSALRLGDDRAGAAAVAGGRRDRAARRRVRLPQGDHAGQPGARGRSGVRVFLAGDPVLHGHGSRRYRHRGAAVAAGALSLAALFEVQNSDPAFFHRLTGRALPLVVLAGVCGLADLALLTAGRTKAIRPVAALGVAAVIWGWGVAQYPVVLPRTAVTLTNAGATQATFVALVVVAIAAVILVVPSFALLYALQGGQMLGGGEHGTPAAATGGYPAAPSAAHSGPPSPNRRHGSAT